MDKLALIELLDRDGRVQVAHAVWRWPVSIGRAIENDLVLDDEHVAPRHALLVDDGAGGVRLHVGSTLNGLQLDGRALKAGDETALASGARLQIGDSRLKLRLRGESLAPEQPLQVGAVSSHRGVGVMVVVALAWLAALRWVELEPGASWSQWLPFLLSAPVALVGWALVWGLASKLFQRHFEFLPHLRLALGYFLAAAAAELLLRTASFMTGWAWPTHLSSLVQMALLVALIHAQLSLVLPQLRRTLAVAMVALFVTGQGVMLALNHQRSDRFFEDLYVTTLGPPALRLAPPVSPRQFIEEAGALKAGLDRKASEDEGDDDEAP
jgi:pSer/pThr/pTyr-binding forkhead associated (FHA) protein